jgi:uncharacterized membrane protein
LKPQRRLLSRFFVGGMAALLPTIITLYIVYRVAAFVHESLGQPINHAFGQLPFVDEERVPWIFGDAVGLLLVLLVCMFVGFVLTSFIGRRIFHSLEGRIARLPVMRVIYPPIKQVTDFLVSDKARPFGRVVAVEYPRKGVYSVGFVTNDGLKDLHNADGEKLIGVFVPSSPTPVTGYAVLVPESELISLDMTVDEALRFIISGGVLVSPGAGQQKPVAEGNEQALAPQASAR